MKEGRILKSYTHLPTNRALSKDKIYIRNRESGIQTSWPLHSHEGYEIYYFIEGVASYIIGDNIFQLLPGDMLIFEGQTLHRVNPDTEVPYVRSYINFLPSYLESLVPADLLDKLLTPFNNVNGKLIRWGAEEKEEIESIFTQIVWEREKEKTGHRFMVQAYLAQLLTHIYRKSREMDPALVVPNATQKEMYVHRILRFINDHYQENLSLDQIAGSLHLNKYYMCHCFKEVTGYTINVYLSKRRLDEAKKMLRTTDLPIGQISDQIGFNSPIHFSRLFKQHLGVSPQAYRNMNTNPDY